MKRRGRIGRRATALTENTESMIAADSEVRILNRAKRLGWISIALGATDTIVPEALATMIGVRTHERTKMTMRLLGVREITAGLGILAEAPHRMALACVAGDVMDLALLERAGRRRQGAAAGHVRGRIRARHRGARRGRGGADAAGALTAPTPARPRSARASTTPSPSP